MKNEGQKCCILLPIWYLVEYGLALSRQLSYTYSLLNVTIQSFHTFHWDCGGIGWGIAIFYISIDFSFSGQDFPMNLAHVV